MRTLQLTLRIKPKLVLVVLQAASAGLEFRFKMALVPAAYLVGLRKRLVQNKGYPSALLFSFPFFIASAIRHLRSSS